MKTLNHTRDVIDLLGGNLAFRKRFKAGQTAVSEWRNIDRFPHWLHFRLLDELPIDYTVPNRCSALRKRQSTNAKSGHATASHQPAGAGARVAMEPAGPKPRHGNGQPAWSAEFTSTLKALWATWTAGELCKLMGITRNAIIGKANRLKLPRKKPMRQR